MKKVVFILIAFVSLSCYAQKENIVTDTLQKESYILLNITTPLDPIAPRYRMGYVSQVTPNWRVGLALGYGNNEINAFGNDGRIEEDYTLWEVRPQVYYMFEPSNKKRPYFSGELFYINHTDNFSDTFYIPENNENDIIRYDNIDYKRQKYGVNFKFGFMFKLIGEFGLDTYIGTGIRVRTVSFSNVINPRIDENFDDELGFGNSYFREEGTVVGVNFTFGANLFYRF
ncbi:hypothetical protein [Patiriisocius hiemis]|uniref:DUF3575 domain-containing protein n=1 Tax=Patiriisocius hiemis TaxID=3075604 RepID=A0ABU2YBG5_9FLAO|nr:hypothetical protein [Constantimarinum sp. W242]MDT0555092.1 hypothetical protein [Constantimarinum sp. W242]